MRKYVLTAKDTKESRSMRLTTYHICLFLLFAGVTRAAPRDDLPVDPDRFEKQTLVAACVDPMGMEVLADGRVLFIERQGPVKLYDPITKSVDQIGHVPVAVYVEVGLLGIAVAPDFDECGFAYLFFCPAENPNVMRLSQFHIRGDHLIATSQKIILEYPIDQKEAVHMGGGLYMSQSGDLYIGTGDNTVPIPGLPIDRRPGNEHLDAMRSSANSRDLRGKILRIHPHADGSYSIPPGNLFPNGIAGAPEIYAMGCRNAFRIHVDERTDTLYWGDVGPNISMDVPIGPNGYDEINRTKSAGNFGWPMMVGPNETYHGYDFATGQLGAAFDPVRPVNHSRNNDGTKFLPPARPAFVWYPTEVSAEFPELGSGGRSAMVGPVYYNSPDFDPVVKLPDSFSGRLFIHDWTRNWIKTVGFDGDGNVTSIEPFMPGTLFRKPMQIQIGTDGSLYVIEFGDKWGDNRDAQIVRIIYRRGNRSPVAQITSDRIGGKEPLTVNFDGSESFDKDRNDSISFSWLVNGKELPESEEGFTYTFDQPGEYRVTLKATDPQGAVGLGELDLFVGNTPPEVSILDPPNGGFFDWGKLIKYRLTVQDEEDGSTTRRSIPSERVSVRATYQQRRNAEEAVLDPGLEMLKSSRCFSCHTTGSPSGGPPYRHVAAKYVSDPEAPQRLGRKVIAGGSGVWGAKVMPPHPQHTLEEASQMVRWILSLSTDRTEQVFGGTEGVIQAPSAPHDPRAHGGALVLEGNYTDDGFRSSPPIANAKKHVLHARRKYVAFFDEFEKVEIAEVFEGQIGMVAMFHQHGMATLQNVDLNGIEAIRCRVASFCPHACSFEFRADTRDGPLLARIDLPPTDSGSPQYRFFDAPIRHPGGPHDLVVIGRSGRTTAEPIASFNWIEFIAAPGAPPSHLKVVFVPLAADKSESAPPSRLCCELLAQCLNRLPNVKAAVSPQLDWPKDHSVIADADSVVFIGSANEHLRHQTIEQIKLLRRLGVGVMLLGHEPSEQIGGETLLPLSSPAGHSIINRLANASTAAHTSAWLDDRLDRGRAACSMIGAQVEDIAQESVRELLSYAILWTARQDLSNYSVDVWLSPSVVAQPRTFHREWTLEELRADMENFPGSRSFAAGKNLFEAASCVGCHKMRNKGGRIGPELTDFADKMAQKSQPLDALLCELVTPSAVVDKDYRTNLLILKTGETLSGIVVDRNETSLFIATDPVRPDFVREISLAAIDEMSTVDQSLMPQGLLNTFNREEIYDLLAYLLAHGEANHDIYATSSEGTSR